MCIELFLCLLLAHLVADFALQTSKSCKHKREYKWRSGRHYGHAALVFGLSWLVAWDLGFWWCALTIGVTHLAIDLWKSYREENVKWFVDEALGLLIAAKSIIRFGEKETAKTEYVLAGTLMSIFIAVLAGLMVTAFK